MNLMAPIMIVLMSLTAVAQWTPPLDPARQAERDARDRNNNPYQPPYITPGHRPSPPPRPRPPMPPPPNYGNDYGNNYGPAYTIRWQDFGANLIPKLMAQDVVLDVRGQFVNEILLRASENSVQVNSVLAYLSNGQVIDIRQATGNIRDGGEFRAQLDYRSSLRVERIVINATSSNLFGSRGRLSVILGLAY
ncbi:MAG: hypothetical protein WA160_10870 [Pseudobdellovibrio sp.]